MGHRGTVVAHAHKHGHARIHLCNTITQPSLPAPSAGVSTTKHSWRMLLTTQTQAPSRSILCIFPSCTHIHTHTHTHTESPVYLSPAQSSLLSTFVWVVIGMVTLSPSFHVKYIVPSLHPPALPPPTPHSSPSLGRCKSILLFMPPKMPLFQV